MSTLSLVEKKKENKHQLVFLKKKKINNNNKDVERPAGSVTVPKCCQNIAIMLKDEGMLSVG